MKKYISEVDLKELKASAYSIRLAADGKFVHDLAVNMEEILDGCEEVPIEQAEFGTMQKPVWSGVDLAKGEDETVVFRKEEFLPIEVIERPIPKRPNKDTEWDILK